MESIGLLGGHLDGNKNRKSLKKSHRKSLPSQRPRRHTLKWFLDPPLVLFWARKFKPVSQFPQGSTMTSRKLLYESIHCLMIVLTLVWPIVQPMQLHAADFYWDSNGIDGDNLLDGTGLGGTGTWDTATLK